MLDDDVVSTVAGDAAGGAYGRTAFDWIQILTLVSIFIGLVLVFYELRQTKNLARAQLAADAWTEKLEQQRALMGESLAVAFAKNCSGLPINLEEQAQLIAYLNHIWDRGVRIEEVARFGEFNADMSVVREGIVKEYLVLPLGREFYEVSGREWPSEYRDTADAVLKAGWTGCDSWFSQP